MRREARCTRMVQGGKEIPRGVCAASKSEGWLISNKVVLANHKQSEVGVDYGVVEGNQAR